MKKCLFITFFFIYSLSSFVLGQDKATPAKKNISVIVGIDSVEKLDFVPQSQEVGNSSILSVVRVPQKKEIIFRGVKPGTTSVTVRNPAGDIKVVFKVTVTATDQSKIVGELKELIGDVEGIEIGIKGNSVFVGGNIVVPQDVGRIAVVLEKYGSDVLRLVEVSPHTQRIIAQKMQTEIQKSGANFKDLTVRIVNEVFWVEGVVTSKEEYAQVEKIVQAYLPDRLDSLAKRTDALATVKRSPYLMLISINAKKQEEPLPKQLKITAQFVELSKDYNRIFGFKWNPLLSEGAGGISFSRQNREVEGRSSGNLAGTISNLFPRLSSARAAGYARVIQSGVMIIKNGTTGTITKQEKKPFGIGTGEFVKPKEATAGLNVTITPNILQKNKVDLKMNITVSALAGDPPQTYSNTMNTNLVVDNKESAVLGGIAVNKTSNDFNRHPPGGIQQADQSKGPSYSFFSFIRSKAFIQTKSQFVVFVTPEIIASASSDTKEIKRKFRKRSR